MATAVALRADAPPSSASALLSSLLEACLEVNAGRVTPALMDAMLTTADRRTLGPDTEPNITQYLTNAAADGRLLAVDGAFLQRTTETGPADEVLRQISAAVIRHDRAVRFGEILDASTFTDAAARDRLSESIRALERSGAVVVAATVRGESRKGRKLYLPVAFAATRERWLPKIPLTFLEYVALVIDRLLERNAKLNASRMPMVKTREVREAIGADRDNGVPVAVARYQVDLARATTVENAMQQWAAGDEPHIRAVPGRRGCWCAATPPADRLSGAATQPVVLDGYACDTDAVLEAARRAARHAPYGVTAAAVQAELAMDLSLGMERVAKVPVTLSDLARKCFSVGKGVKWVRRVQSIRRLGRVGRQMHYWVADAAGQEMKFEAMQQAFADGQLHAQWCAGRFAGRVSELGEAFSPVIARARAVQIAEELDELASAIPAPNYASEANAVSEPIDAFAKVRSDVRTVRARVDGWLRFRSSPANETPADARVVSFALTARELLDLYAPFSGVATRITEMRDVRGMYGKRIRSVPNPANLDVQTQRRPRPHAACFDGLDARCYLAAQWGGPTVKMLALRAQREMGDLRNVRYPLLALEDEAPKVRRAAIACLAMLGDVTVELSLRSRARNDVDAGVREVAIFALGLLIGPGAADVLHECAANDPADNPRRIAKRALKAGDNWAWRM